MNRPTVVVKVVEGEYEQWLAIRLGLRKLSFLLGVSKSSARFSDTLLEFFGFFGALRGCFTKHQDFPNYLWDLYIHSHRKI